MDKRQEAEQKWQKYYESYYGGDGDDFEGDEHGRDIASSNAIIDYKSALREEIEKQLSDMNKNAEGTKQKFYKHNHIFSVIDILQLIDEVIPK